MENKIKKTALKELGGGPNGLGSFANCVPLGSISDNRLFSKSIIPIKKLIVFNVLIIDEAHMALVFYPMHLVFLSH